MNMRTMQSMKWVRPSLHKRIRTVLPGMTCALWICGGVAMNATIGLVTLRAQTTVATHGTNDNGQTARELLARPITMTLDHVSLQVALDSISIVAKVLVQYRLPTISAYSAPVTLHATRLPLGVALERVLDGTNLRVVPDGQGYLTVVTTSIDGKKDSTVATGTIVGRVVDSATGRGVTGATIKIADTKLTFVSRDSGRFVINHIATGEHFLTIRAFGYRPAERNVTVPNDDRVTVRVSLVPAPNVLSGVVTTATGEQDRRTVGNDITVINADSIMRVAPIRTLTDLLDGRVPGLTVQHTSGVPGAPSRLRLRGITGGLVNGAPNRSNDPILIVDGIRVYASSSTGRDQNGTANGYTAPSGFDQIDPNSIDKVEVLKGPSASALYGPDASNGVIVVTTKRGQAGPTRIDATASYGLNYLPGTYAGPGFYNFGHDVLLIGTPGPAGQCGGLNFTTSQGIYDCVRDSLVQFQALNVPRLSLFGVGNERNATASISGGTSAITYVGTASTTRTLGYLKMPELYQDQYAARYNQPVPKWMKRPNTYTTSSGQGSVSSVPYSGLRLTLSTTMTTSDQLQSSAQTGISVLSGKYIDTTVLQDTALGQYTQRVDDRTTTTNVTGSIAWSRWAWFPMSAVVGRNVTDRDDHATVPFGYFGPVNFDTTGSYAYARTGTHVQTLNMAGQLFPSGRITTNTGLNIVTTTEQDFTGSTPHLTPGVSVPTTFVTAGQSGGEQRSAGWYLEPRLNLNSRFFVAPGFRIDNTGNQGTRGTSGKSGFSALLPKMDFSWIAIDREGARPFAGFVTLLRPRVAFGVSAVQPDPTELLRTFSTGTVQNYVGVPYAGIQLNTVGNPDLQPERSRELEGGFEADLWGNRLQLSATSAYKLTTDQIAAVPIAPSAGSSSLQQYVNIGTVRNTSAELAATAILLQSASTSWTVNASYSATKNIVVKLNGEQGVVDFGDGTRIVAGYPIGGRWERPILGYATPAAGHRLSAADIFIGDSAQYVGWSQPKFTLPVSTSLSLWGNTVLISANFDYEHGFTQFGSGSLQLLANLYMDSSASLGQQAAVIAAYCQLASNSVYVATALCRSKATNFGVVQTVNVLRFQSVGVSFNVPSSMRQRFRLPRTSIALQGSNVGLWTGYRGKDPDVNGTPIGEAIQDSGQEPLPRTWRLQISLGQ